MLSREVDAGRPPRGRDPQAGYLLRPAAASRRVVAAIPSPCTRRPWPPAPTVAASSTRRSPAPRPGRECLPGPPRPSGGPVDLAAGGPAQLMPVTGSSTLRTAGRRRAAFVGGLAAAPSSATRGPPAAGPPSASIPEVPALLLPLLDAKGHRQAGEARTW